MLTFVQSVRSAHSSRAIIVAMALRELQSKYVGTLGGGLWALAHPIAVVAIYYLVFAIGFRATGPRNSPFILWFVCGWAAWLFFAEVLQAMVDSVTKNKHLVKKIAFPTEILPLVPLVSNLIPHTVFLCAIAVLLGYYGIPFQIERLGILYFLACNAVLLTGLGWLVAALQVFYRDIGQALAILLNLLFWATPIVWSSELLPPSYHWVFMYNPVFYVVDGYRGLLIADVPIWPAGQATIAFWLTATLLFIAGNYVFRRLKPEFADII